MTDIFREVDEDVRRERYQDLWKKYGGVIIAGVVAIAVGVLGVNLWRSYQASERAKEADQFLASAELLADEDSAAAAATAFGALADDAGKGYRVLALFQQAAALSEAGQKGQAVDIYDKIAEDGGAGDILQDLARIKAAQLLQDTSSADDLRARLASVLSPDNDWAPTAREIVAFAAFREGELIVARDEYQAIMTDPATPQNMRTRAFEMLAILGPGPSADSDEMPSDGAVNDDSGDAAPMDGDSETPNPEGGAN